MPEIPAVTWLLRCFEREFTRGTKPPTAAVLAPGWSGARFPPPPALLPFGPFPKISGWTQFLFGSSSSSSSPPEINKYLRAWCASWNRAAASSLAVTRSPDFRSVDSVTRLLCDVGWKRQEHSNSHTHTHTLRLHVTRVANVTRDGDTHRNSQLRSPYVIRRESYCRNTGRAEFAIKPHTRESIHSRVRCDKELPLGLCHVCTC